MKVYALFSEGKQQGSRIWKSEQIAIKEMELSNKQFEKYNKYIQDNKMDKKIIPFVEVRQINFNPRNNLDI